MTFKAQFWQRLYQFHMYVGVYVALHFMIFGLTGLLLIFKDDLQTHAAVFETQEDVAITSDLYQKAYEAWRAEYPLGRMHAIYPQDEQDRIIHFRFRTDDKNELRGSPRASYDLITGNKIQNAKVKQKKFWDYVLILHRDLFLGSIGKLYLGFVGCLYLFILFAGLILYGRFMRFRRFGQIRISTVFKIVDWHKFLGVITWGWAVLVAFTGILLSFNAVLIKFFQLKTLNSLVEKLSESEVSIVDQVQISLEQLVQVCKEVRPEAVLEYISFPGTEYGVPGQFLVLMESTTKLSQTLTEILMIDAKTGAITEIVMPPLILKFLLYSEPLHFANYGGMALKIIWAIMTLLSMCVVGLGVSSFVIKRIKIKLKFSPQDRQRSSTKTLSIAEHYKWPLCIIISSFLSILMVFLFRSFL